MLWLNSHARSRRRLSPYIDGHLSPRERATLEAHLAACDACSRELGELRATISAVGGLADVEPPRSFALTRRMLEQRAAVPLASLPPLANGMRLAGAGVAFVLAVVLVGDLGGVGGGNSGGEESAGTRGLAEIHMNDSDNRDAAAGYAAPAATSVAEGDAFVGEDRAAPEDLSSEAEKTEACPPGSARGSGNAQGMDGGGAGGVGGPATGAQETTSTPAPTVSPAPPPEAVGATVECGPVAAIITPFEIVVEPLREGDQGDEGEIAATVPETLAEDGGGVSTLTVIEIILAGGLAALVGAVVVEYMLRRRAV